jgi:hypothetical protein
VTRRYVILCLAASSQKSLQKEDFRTGVLRSLNR